MYNEIIRNSLFLECLHKISELEKERKFCKHDMEHSLDVARLAYIMSLEDGKNIRKDIIYAAGLLHDIGRHEEYLNNTPHEVASADIAESILAETGFEKKDIIEIKKAILEHRNKDISKQSSLSGYLCRADKFSRRCFACDAQDECKWPDDKKNMDIKL